MISGLVLTRRKRESLVIPERYPRPLPRSSRFSLTLPQRMILEGRHTSKLTLARLLDADIPLSWEAQRRLLEDLMID